MFNLKNNNNDELYELYNGIKESLREISNQCFLGAKRTKAIEEYCQAIFPSDKDSIQQRRRENLAKIYARHLSETKGLSLEHASIQARFEVLKFDNDKLLDEINRRIGDKEQKSAENNFYNSGIVERDIESFWTIGDMNTEKRWIAPYDLFAPIYAYIKGRQYKEGLSMSIDSEADKDYYTFIRNRAVSKNLERLGILSKVLANERPRNIEDQNYILNITDLNKIGEIIYEGSREGHDDSFFDERLAEGRLESVFKIER